LQPGDHLGRGGAAGFLGLALWASGDLGAALPTFAEAVSSLKKAGNMSEVISGAVVLADMQIGQGCLRDARRTLDQAWQLAVAQGELVPRATADLLVAQSELLREQNELDAAEHHLQRSKAFGDGASLTENRYRWFVALARIREAQGDPDAALDLLEQAEPMYLRGFYPEVRPIAALMARIWIARGRLAQAQDWMSMRGLSASDDLSYLREFEHLTLARLFIAQYRLHREESAIRQAIDLLGRLLEASETGGRTGTVNEILVLQALAHQAQGHLPEAVAALERVLTQAEPEGFVRLFADEGPPMAALLEEAAKRGISPNYVSQLRAALGMPDAQAADRGEMAVTQPLAEPLSQRELEVLRLLRTDMSGREIAGELSISLNTLHTHTRNIYGKLGVNSRQAAVHRAEELNLLLRTSNIPIRGRLSPG
jgi:LuxR family maltose regulon positive regulatory protein